MSNLFRPSGLFFLFIFLTNIVSAQIQKGQYQTDANGYKFLSFKNDPVKLRIYTLDNGLKVYLAPNPEVPRIRTSIMVKAGSKHDPAEATGLAHYLEHMLFKGTDRFGTINFEKEGPLLDKIEDLFEQHRQTENAVKKKEIYQQIDSVSQMAAQYALSNEYNDILSEMGAWRVNAFTTFDRTGYISNIPSNQLERWLKLEAERFRNPQFRTFHTELETVYEEMNTIIDNGPRYTLFQMFELLFPTHQYGSQTAIGKIEHLKNPSIRETKKYYQTYYVPNNMALMLVGDFDPNTTIQLVDQYFRYMEAKPIPDVKTPVERPITQPQVRHIEAPGPEMLRMGYRFKGIATEEALMVELVDMMLMNGRAGIFDLNINKAQKAQEVSTYIEAYRDYSIHFIYGAPKEGQSLQEVKDLILQEINKLKTGDFPDWLQEAAINDLRQRHMRTLESNDGRSGLLISSFSFDIPWDERLNRIEKLTEITREEIMDFVKTHYKNNYGLVYKKRGLNERIQKIQKPDITPIQLVRDQQSDFRKRIQAMPIDPIAPEFIDFKTDIDQVKLANGVPVYSVKNTTNDLFTLHITFDEGQNKDKLLALAVEYLSLAGTDKMSAIQIQEAFYQIGCSFNVSTGLRSTDIYISGLSENMSEALRLFRHLLSDIEPDGQVMQRLSDKIAKERSDLKNSKNDIRQWGLNYMYYGPNSPYKNIFSMEEINHLSPQQLTQKVKEPMKYQHRVFYYGPLAPAQLKKVLEKDLEKNKALETVSKKLTFRHEVYSENQLFLANTTSKQIDLVIVSPLQEFDPELIPMSYMFYQYFNFLFYDELREARGLAYSAYSNMTIPTHKGLRHQLYARVGAQSDKYLEAVQTAHDLIRNMPFNESAFEQAKTAMMEKLRSERIVNFSRLNLLKDAQNRGMDEDLRKIVFEAFPKMTMDDFKAFYQKHVQQNPMRILIVGDEAVVDEKKLKGFGKVTKLSGEDIFGF